MTIAAEFPFIRVTIDTRGLQPAATRAFGNVAVVGSTGGFGTAVPDTPIQIGSEAEARAQFADVDGSGAIANDGADAGPLYHAVRTVLLQDPAPSRVFAVATDDSDGSPGYTAALASLAATPVQFVALAGETDPAALAALKNHVETVSADGDRRIGVAMVDPDLAVAEGSTFAQAAEAAYSGVKSDVSRMVLAAARVPVTGGVPAADVAAAVMGAMAGYPPHISVLMKQIRGVSVPLARQFSGSEIKQLAEQFMLPLIDPELVPGEGIFMGSGRCYTTDTSRLYVDVIRVLDDIEFRLKAGLIGTIGNVQIDRLGMQALRSRIDAILGPLATARVIAGYSTEIPLLPVLELEESLRSPGAVATLTAARTSRIVEVLLSVTYAGSVHFLDVNLALRA
ncbi:hypothetical protein [Micromonospora sp. NPDC049679]|uniref:hypothetical protein n=1 Tax=Micromonospora sp. NPDC049679 TaxID=3155920 RepID=UPI0033F3EB3C